MKSKLRILQLIDSLDTGGAERMAINYANTLAENTSFSALVTTRKEGTLKEQLSNKVGYLFLNKKGKFGFVAVLKLRGFIKQNKIHVIHAHSTSFFTALLVKLTYPKIRIVWHDHHGNRVNKKGNTNSALKLASSFFYGVLTVNKELEIWAKEHLNVKKSIYFPNFISLNTIESPCLTLLEGTVGKRIVFLANLKKPKNHLEILKAFTSSEGPALGWSLHLIGKDFDDVYSGELKQFITSHELESHIFIYGSCTDVDYILSQCDIGVLGSIYEGFPVTLLEYGKAKLAVLSTHVGYCQTIIQPGRTGLLFDPRNRVTIVSQFNALLSDKELRHQYALQLHHDVVAEYSDQVVIGQYLEWLEQ